MKLSRKKSEEPQPEILKVQQHNNRSQQSLIRVLEAYGVVSRKKGFGLILSTLYEDSHWYLVIDKYTTARKQFKLSTCK